MNKDEALISKLTFYYEKVKNPTYKINNWIITNDDLYLKYNNKLTLNNIISNLSHKDEKIIVAEDKKYYYAIKYNNRFICFRQTETEYGLVIGDYDLLAVNTEILYSNSKQSDVNNITLAQLAKTFNWKLGKKAKEYLDYYKNFEQF